MTDPDDLFEGWDQSADRIAWWCAKTRRSDTPRLGLEERHEAALDGILEYIAMHGWPEAELHPLFQAASRSIAHEAHEVAKHLRHWSYWYSGAGIDDPLGEGVTDKLAVWQVIWSLTDKQWSVLWALAEVFKWGGTWRDAAALLEMSPGAYRMLLCTARKRCRELWIAPGDTARGHWARGASWSITRNTMMAGRLRNRDRNRVRAEDHRQALAEAVNAGDAQLADAVTLSVMTGGNVPIDTIRQWARDGALTRRGKDRGRWVFSVDEFVKLAIKQGRLGNDPRRQAA